MKHDSKMRMSTLLALSARSQDSLTLEWPKDFGVYIAGSSEEIPAFPLTLSGFRSEEGRDFWNKPFPTRGWIRISKATIGKGYGSFLTR